MSCDCDDNLLAFVLRVLRAYTSSANDLYAISPWMPASADVRAAIRLLAEQSDGLEVTVADQTAKLPLRPGRRASMTGSRSAPTVTTEGDSAPRGPDGDDHERKFWIRWALPSASLRAPMASVRRRWVRSSASRRARATLLAGPAVIDAYTSPVGGSWTELLALAACKPPGAERAARGAQ